MYQTPKSKVATNSKLKMINHGIQKEKQREITLECPPYADELNASLLFNWQTHAQKEQDK